MNAGQCRAARAFLGWRHQMLVDRSGLSSSTISTFEAGVVKPHASTVRRLKETFEGAGIVFVPNGVTKP